MKEEITAIVDQLADKLEVPVAYLWDALIAQALIAGISDLIIYAGLAGTSWLAFKLIGKYSVSHNGEEPVLCEDVRLFAIFFAIVFSVIFALASLLNIPNTLGALFNPAYWALSQLIN